MNRTQTERTHEVGAIQVEPTRLGRSGSEVLKGIDLEVAPQDVFCLVGPSGSGKSTFLRCINHLEKIDSGRLSVDGELVGPGRGSSPSFVGLLGGGDRQQSAWSGASHPTAKVLAKDKARGGGTDERHQQRERHHLRGGMIAQQTSPRASKQCWWR